MRANSRIALLTFDALSVLAIAAFLVAGLPHTAWAYVDPSVMTYTIQALAGVAIAVSTVLGVALRRTRKKLLKLLNIDENAGKEIEPDVHRVKPGNAAIASDELEGCEYSKKGAERGTKTAPLSWRNRSLLSLPVALFAIYTIGLVAPLEMVAGNSDSLFFGVADIWPVMLAASTAVATVLTIILSATRGRVFSMLLLTVFGLGLCAYVQALFLNVGLPVANGERVVWNDYTTITVISGAAWLLILGACIGSTFLSKVPAQRLAAALSICLLVIQGVGVASLFEDTHKSSHVATTEQGLFEVSDSNNVIVFVLDSYDTAQLNQLLKSNPDMLNEMTGFTYYPDSAGSMIPTHHAIPYLLSDRLPESEETYSDYMARRYLDSTFIEGMANSGYSVGLYSDTLGYATLPEDAVQGKFIDSTVNVRQMDDLALDAGGTIGILWKCSLYRDAPWLLKKHFWFYTDEMNNSMMSNDGGEDLGKTIYQMDDARYYQRLQEFGLSVEEGDFKGSFKFIHLTGPHYPFNLDERGNYIGVDESTSDRQALGSMHIVSEYLAQLKELGLYDCSTIIITADHGKWFLTSDPLEEAVSPIMLVKPASTEGLSVASDETPYKTSPIPVSHMDLPATVYDAMGLDCSQYGTPIGELAEEDRVRFYYTTTSTEDAKAIDIVEYETTGNALDINNWHMTGRTWSTQG